MNQDNGATKLIKALVPLALVAIALFQVVMNRGHVDNNIVGALVFIAVGGTAGYAIDRLIQNLYWARSTGGVDRRPDELEEPDTERRQSPRRQVRRRKRGHRDHKLDKPDEERRQHARRQVRRRKPRPAYEEDVHETPDAVTEEG